MSYVKVYIHFVWSTKERVSFLDSLELRQKVWFHIRENARAKGIFIDFVNGHKDHCHCLVSLGADQTIQKVMQLIKGESSYWINKNHLTKNTFEWQDEYWAVSVSESILERVRNYIKSQEEHHTHASFKEECDEFISKYGLERFKD